VQEGGQHEPGQVVALQRHVLPTAGTVEGEAAGRQLLNERQGGLLASAEAARVPATQRPAFWAQQVAGVEGLGLWRRIAACPSACCNWQELGPGAHPRCNTRAGSRPEGGGLGPRSSGVAAPLLLGLAPYGAEAMLIVVMLDPVFRYTKAPPTSQGEGGRPARAAACTCQLVRLSLD
jgi:hypothetical protein